MPAHPAVAPNPGHMISELYQLWLTLFCSHQSTSPRRGPRYTTTWHLSELQALQVDERRQLAQLLAFSRAGSCCKLLLLLLWGCQRPRVVMCRLLRRLQMVSCLSFVRSCKSKRCRCWPPTLSSLRLQRSGNAVMAAKAACTSVTLQCCRFSAVRPVQLCSTIVKLPAGLSCCCAL